MIGLYESIEQSAHVGLSGRRQGYGVHEMESGRDHVIRQPPRDRRANRAGIEENASAGNDEGPENGLSVFFVKTHRARFHAFLNRNCGLDLVQFDSVSPDFHLPVVPSEIPQISRRIPAGQISRPIPPSFVGLREPLVRKLLLSEISVGEGGSENVDFSDFPVRNGQPRFVQQTYPYVRNRLSDGRKRVRSVEPVDLVRRNDVGLGGSVLVPQCAIRALIEKFPDGRGQLQRLSCRNDLEQPIRAIRCGTAERIERAIRKE